MKKIIHGLALLCGLILFGLLFYHIGPALIWQDVVTLGWSLIPLVLLAGLSELFHAIGFRHCLSGRDRYLPLMKVFAIRLAGSSVNQLTPTAGFGGDVTRGVLLSSTDQGAAAAAVIIDKLSSALAQLLFIVLGSALLVRLAQFSRGVWVAMVLGIAFLGSGMIAFLFVQRHGRLGAIVRWLVQRRAGGAVIRKISGQMTEVDAALSGFYRSQPRDFPISILWHLLGIGIDIVPVFYFLTLIATQPYLILATGVVLLGNWFNMVTFVLPTDIGVQESTRVLAFTALGLPPAMGMAYGIVLRMQQLAMAGGGLLAYGMLVTKKDRAVKTTRICRSTQGEACDDDGERRGGEV